MMDGWEWKIRKKKKKKKKKEKRSNWIYNKNNNYILYSIEIYNILQQ